VRRRLINLIGFNCVAGSRLSSNRSLQVVSDPSRVWLMEFRLPATPRATYWYATLLILVFFDPADKWLSDDRQKDINNKIYINRGKCGSTLIFKSPQSLIPSSWQWLFITVQGRWAHFLRVNRELNPPSYWSVCAREATFVAVCAGRFEAVAF